MSMTNQQWAPEALRLPVQTLIELHQGLANNLHDGPARNLHLATVAALVEAQRPDPSAGAAVGNSGFDYQTAADLLNGKSVSDEAMRKFVSASRWAHDDRVGLRATLLSVRGDLASREAEITLLKKALMDAEASQPSPTPLSGITDEQLDLLNDAKHKIQERTKMSTTSFGVPTPQADSQPAAWLDAFGDPHKRREDAMSTEESSPVPLYRASRAPADSVTAPAGEVLESEDMRRARHIAVVAQRWIGDRTGLGALLYIGDLAWALKTLAAATTPPAQAADSVLEDAALLQEARTALWQPANVDLCERIDAYLSTARKQGGAT